MKKIITNILSIILAFSFVTSCVFANASSLDAAVDAQYPELEIHALAAIGIIDQSDYADGYASFTRGQLAERVVKVMNPSLKPSPRQLSFIDVAASESYYAAVGECVAQGILNGFSDYVFKPSQECTATEAIVALMRALGYRQVAEATGGYSANYIAQAGTSGLLDGISGDEISGECSNALFAKLLYNMLSVRVYEVVGIEDGSPVIKRGDEYMTEVLGIGVHDGVVTANRITSLSAGIGAGNGYAAIDNITYSLPEADMLDGLLGYSVRAWFDESADKLPRLLFVEADSDVTVTRIAKDDITLISGNSITYDTGSDSKTVNIPASAYLMYNNFPADSLKPIVNDGYYVCIDNNADRKIDVVMIEDYTSLFIESVNINEGRVYDEYDALNNLSFKPSDVGENVFIYDEDGKPASMNELEKNIVYSVLRSENDKIIVIRAIINEVVGPISEARTEGGYFTHLTIGGTEVEISDAMKPHLDDVVIGKTTLIAYCDIMGKLVAFDDVTSSAKKFAYLMNVAKDTGLENGIRVKMYVAGSAKGEMSSFECANSIDIDGIAYKLDSQLNEIFALIDAAKSTVVTFELNKDNKLTKLGTISGGSLMSVGSGASDVFYTNRIGNVGITSGCMVLFIPGSGEEDKFRSGSRSTLLYNSSYANYEGYKTEEDEIGAELLTVVSNNAADSLGGDSSHMVVTEVSKALNAEGDEALKVSGYVLGELASYIVSESTEISSLAATVYSDLQVGDVIRYSADANGTLTLIQLMYRASTDTITNDQNPSNSDIYAKPRVLRAKAYKTTKEFILLSFKDPAAQDFDETLDTELRAVSEIDAVYIYDKNEEGSKKIKPASKGDIMTYYKHGEASELFGVTRGTLLETVIIIK